MLGGAVPRRLARLLLAAACRHDGAFLLPHHHRRGLSSDPQGGRPNGGGGDVDFAADLRRHVKGGGQRADEDKGISLSTDHASRPVDPQMALSDGSYEKDDPPMVYAYKPR